MCWLGLSVYTVGSVCLCTSHVAHVAAVLVSCLSDHFLNLDVPVVNVKTQRWHACSYTTVHASLPALHTLVVHKQTHGELDLQRSSSLWQSLWTTPSYVQFRWMNTSGPDQRPMIKCAISWLYYVTQTQWQSWQRTHVVESNITWLR